MKTFDLIRWYMRYLGIWQWISGQHRWILTILSNFIFLALSFITLFSSVGFFVFTAQAFSEYVESFYYILHSLLLVSWYLIYLIQGNKYQVIFEEVETIIKKRSKKHSKTIYDAIDNRIVTVIEKMHVALRYIALVLFILPRILISIFKLITTNYSTDSFQQMFPATYPFDWKTFAGYAACSFFQATAALATVEIFLCSLVLISGFCLFITAFITDLETELKHLNSNLQNQSDWTNCADKSALLNQNLIEIMRFYFQSKETTARFSDINRALIFAYIAYTILSFCSLFLQMNTSLATVYFVHVVQLIVPIQTAVFWLLLFCIFGNYVTQRFEDGSDAMYQLDWYLLPLDVQRNLRIFIVLAQKRVYLRGFVGTQCTHEMFKQIMKTTFSYFTILRQFY